MRKNLFVGITLLFLAFVTLSAIFVLSPQSITWKSSFPCCFLFEVGAFNVLLWLMLPRVPAGEFWRELASWLGVFTAFLPAGLFLAEFTPLWWARALVPLGIWSGLGALMVLLAWPPK